MSILVSIFGAEVLSVLLLTSVAVVVTLAVSSALASTVLLPSRQCGYTLRRSSSFAVYFQLLKASLFLDDDDDDDDDNDNDNDDDNDDDDDDTIC